MGAMDSARRLTGATTLVLALMAGAFGLAQNIPAATVRAGVVQALLEEPALSPYPVAVLVRSDGAVLLSGVVPTRQDRELATTRAKDVPGVFGIRNRIVVDPRAVPLAPEPVTGAMPESPPAAASPAASAGPAAASRRRTESEIQHALGAIPALAGVTAKAYRAVIVLTGVVPSREARKHAEDLTRRQAAASAVDNEIQVVSPQESQTVVY